MIAQSDTAEQGILGATESTAAETQFVYALGRIESRFPTLGVEKEFMQAAGRNRAAGMTDHEVMHAVLSERANRYLVRQLCWVFIIQGLETYLVSPSDPADLDLLIDAVRPRPSPGDLDVVIGIRGPLTPPDVCNGLVVPLVRFDQLYSFDRESLLAAIPRPDEVQEEHFQATAEEVLETIVDLTDNAGSTAEHRALNYLAVRSAAVYGLAAASYLANKSFRGVEVNWSALSGVRLMVDVIFEFTDRQTDIAEKHFIRVDVTEEFPFIAAKLKPYYER